jgi:hypothetical protein
MNIHSLFSAGHKSIDQSPGPPVSYTNKTDRHDATEILLKVALNTTKQKNIEGGI